jgi:hypothetical protein
MSFSVLILECIPGILIPSKTAIQQVNEHPPDYTIFVLA